MGRGAADDHQVSWPLAQDLGFNVRTLRRARKALQIRSLRVWIDARCHTYWLLPGQQLPGFIAECAGRIAGLVTFDVRPGVLEIVTINALDRYAGIGTMLIEAVRAEAKRLGCQEITLTTTNDNIEALRFYQRRGFRLAALRPGAVDRSRLVKPEIPRTGDFGIPLRDEIDLTCSV